MTHATTHEFTYRGATCRCVDSEYSLTITGYARHPALDEDVEVTGPSFTNVSASLKEALDEALNVRPADVAVEFEREHIGAGYSIWHPHVDYLRFPKAAEGTPCHISTHGSGVYQAFVAEAARTFKADVYGSPQSALAAAKRWVTMEVQHRLATGDSLENGLTNGDVLHVRRHLPSDPFSTEAA